MYALDKLWKTTKINTQKQVKICTYTRHIYLLYIDTSYTTKMHRADEVSIYNKYIAPINIMTKYAYYIHSIHTKPIYSQSM